MLSILLVVLKVLLYILLTIVLITIGLLLLILICPIKYVVDGKKYEAITMNLRISWFFRIISLRFKIEEKNRVISFKIFGITLGKRNKNTLKDMNKNEKTVTSTSGIKKEVDPKKDAKTFSNIEDNLNNQDVLRISDNVDKKIKKEEDKDKDLNKKISPKIKRKEKKVKKQKKKKNNWLDQFLKIKDLIINNKDLFGKLKKKIVSIIRHILPKKYKVTIELGTGDPATTGYLVGALSIFYTIGDNNMNITPDFEEKVFKGCFYGKGRIYLIVLVINAIGIILDKRVRKLIKQF